MHLVEICESDFEEWFNELADKQGQERLLEVKSTEGQEASRFAKLLARCARKCLHLSIPVQTFVPVSM